MGHSIILLGDCYEIANKSITFSSSKELLAIIYLFVFYSQKIKKIKKTTQEPTFYARLNLELLSRFPLSSNFKPSIIVYSLINMKVKGFLPA